MAKSNVWVDLWVVLLIKMNNYQYFEDFTLGGVLGLGFVIWAILCSAGFKIWKEQIKFSSTLIRAPELLNYPQ